MYLNDDVVTLVVANLKGGSTKTTSAVFMAHVLHERGHKVLLVDADPQGSAARWHEFVGFGFPTIRLDSGRLHRDLRGITGDRYEAIVIDTPPLDGHRGIVLSALRVATHVLIPCAPTPIEYERVAIVRESLAEAATLRRDESEPASAVLLTRTVSHAASTSTFRELITEDGTRVLRPVIGRLERFSQAYGGPVINAAGTGYGDAVTELLALNTKDTR